MKVWLRNLATDEDIEFDLPMSDTDLKETMEEYIGNNEYIIVDSDLVPINENVSISTVNEFALVTEDSGLDDDIIRAVTNYYLDLDEVVNIIENERYMIYYDCDNMGDVAYQYLNETGMISELPDWAVDYFDYCAYGDTMETESTFIGTNNGYIQIFE